MASLSEKLTQHGQSHVLHYWNELNGEQKKRLQDQLDQWNLSEVCSTFTESMSELKQKKASPCHNASTLKPLPTDRYLDRSEISSEHLASLKEIGLKAVANGEVAVVLLAGGQGTRLGSTEPKGMYNIGLPSGKSLFQVQVERLIRLQRLAVAVDSNATNRPVHLFVMTSPVTHQDTETYFKQQSYFGLKPEQVHFLQQAVMPCFGLEGELLLADRDRLAESPDGNGGIYSALARSGSLDRMRQLGVKYVHVYCVDNILVRVADPAFVGFAVQRQLAAVAKAVNKRSADEPVGVFGLIDDRLRVLEYSEITCQQSESTDSDGRLTYRLGNICNHLFTLDFLYQVANTRLPQHVALKKIPNLDVKSGDLIQPQSPNGIKLEKFIFDVFELTSDFGIWVVPRDEEFSPVKNSPNSSEDSPITARNDLYRLNTRFVANASGLIKPSENDDSIPVCEISPLLSYEGENLEKLVTQKSFQFPLVLYDPSENRPNIINLIH